MIRTPMSAAIAALAFTLSGCVVENYTPPPSQQPVYTPQPTYAPQPGPLRIAGPWQLREKGRVVRVVSVERVQGGILVDNGRRERQFAERVGRGTFRDERGRTYQFFDGNEGIFENPNNGRRLRMRRPG